MGFPGDRGINNHDQDNMTFTIKRIATQINRTRISVVVFIWVVIYVLIIVYRVCVSVYFQKVYLTALSNPAIQNDLIRYFTNLSRYTYAPYACRFDSKCLQLILFKISTQHYILGRDTIVVTCSSNFNHKFPSNEHAVTVVTR